MPAAPKSPPLPASNLPPRPDDKPSLSKDHFFHIGILGTSTSGKTCFLAALAMPRQPHPLKYKATWVPAGNRPGKELQKGHQWISSAVATLRAGNRPQGNDPSDPVHAVVRYSLADAQEKHWIQIVDYAGELLNEEKSPDALAEVLKKKLEKMDGLLVLAPHSAGDGGLSASPKALNSLCTAFNKISEKRTAHRVPIAFVISKWDLSGHLSADGSHEDQEAQVKAFMAGKPPPMHAGVWDDLHSSAWGGCKVFAVSAFGATPPSDKTRPIVTEPLLSYGLEDPLVWLTEQITAQKKEEMQRRLSWLSCLNPISALFTAIKAGRFRKRFMSGSQNRRFFSSKRRQALGHMFFSLAFWMLSSELAWDWWRHEQTTQNLANITKKDAGAEDLNWLREYGGSPLYRHILYSNMLPWIGEMRGKLGHVPLIEKIPVGGLPKAQATQVVNDHFAKLEALSYEQIEKSQPKQDEHPTVSQLQTFIDLLDKYLIDFPGGLNAQKVAVKKSESAAKQTEMAAGELFRVIEEAFKSKEWDRAIQLCKEYNTKYSRCSHSSKVSEFRSQIEQRRTEETVKNQLAGWGTQIDLLTRGPGEHSEKLEALLKLASEVRNNTPVLISEDLKKQRDELLHKIDTEHKRQAAKLATEEEINRIKGLVQAKQLLEAAKALADAQDRTDKDAFSGLIKDFQDNFLERLKAKCEEEASEGREWRKAAGTAAAFLSDNDARLLRNLMTNPMKEGAGKLRAEQIENGDRYFYQKVMKERYDASHLKKYMQEFGDEGSMRAEVQAFAGYLKERDKPRPITVKLVRIDWAKDAVWETSFSRTDDTRCVLRINDREDLWQDASCKRTGSNEKSPHLASVTLDSVLQTDEVKISADLQKWVDEYDFLLGGHDHWDSTASFSGVRSAEVWTNKHADLEVEVKTNLQDTLHLKIEGVVPEPNLPEWRKP